MVVVICWLVGHDYIIVENEGDKACLFCERCGKTARTARVIDWLLARRKQLSEIQSQAEAEG